MMYPKARLWWLLVFLGAVSVAFPQEPGNTGVDSKENAAIQDAVFQYLIPKDCRRHLCLFAVNGKPLEEERVKRLAKLGRVTVASPEDLEQDELGVPGAYRSRGASVIYIEETTKRTKDEAVVWATVNYGPGSFGCQYVVHRHEADWKVVGSERCVAA